MSLPRRRSRSLTVAGQTYRWLVRGPDPDHTFEILIDSGRGLLRWRSPPAYGSEQSPVFSARTARALVTHARSTGWDGQDLLYTGPAPRTRSRLEGWLQHADLSGVALWNMLDIDAVRVAVPWPVQRNQIVVFRLRGGMTDLEVGSLVACLIQHHAPKTDQSLAGLADAAAEHDEQWGVSGGMWLVSAGGPLMHAGCCAGIHGWTAWADLLNSGVSPWNGHDPFSSARVAGDLVLISDGESDVYPLSHAEYAALIDAVAGDMAGAAADITRWLSQHAPEAAAAAIGARLPEVLGLAAG